MAAGGKRLLVESMDFLWLLTEFLFFTRMFGEFDLESHVHSFLVWGGAVSIHGFTISRELWCLEAIGLLRNSVIPVEARNLRVSAVGFRCRTARFLSDLQKRFQAKDYHFLITA